MGTIKLNLCFVQESFQVGDLSTNVSKILDSIKQFADADVIITPEFSLCGYPPEDLVAYPEFILACKKALEQLQSELAKLNNENLHVIVSLPQLIKEEIFNTAVVLNLDKVVALHLKNNLPNYGVFDEKRYFAAGNDIATFKVKDNVIALAVCHDIWVNDYKDKLKKINPDLLIAVNASPFYLQVEKDRLVHTTKISKDICDVAYVNMCGAQDEHIFDGGSHYVQNGKAIFQLPQFTQVSSMVTNDYHKTSLSTIEQITKALILGIKSYVTNSSAKRVFVGVSGGIDSAVVLALAQQALGSENVTAVSLPSKITSQMSNDDAKQLADNLNIEYLLIEINDIFTTTLTNLENKLARKLNEVAFENLQSRIRSNILMALANDASGLVLTTGNKSEMATGYATLYGDMAGAFDVLKDINKQRVYELANYLNQETEVIPKRIIEREPTAELQENQFDSDSLPDYSILDKLLEEIVEDLNGPNKLLDKFKRDDILRFVDLLEASEFKRRQAPIGPTITKRAFGKSWRMPVSNKFSFKPYLDEEHNK